MKKILILLLLLLNLHIITDKGDLRVGFGTISAQTMMQEQLGEVVVIGSLYVDCDWCRCSVPRSNLAFHKQYDCPARTIECEMCHVTYKAYEGHYCNTGGGSTGGSTGGNTGGSTGGSTGGNSGTSSGSSSSGNAGQTPPDPPHDPQRNISISDLTKKVGVTLVKKKEYMPDKLHKQTKGYECVARAYAFMAELGGHNYETALIRMYDIAQQKGRDLNKKGIYPEELTTFFEDYCNVEMEEFEPAVVDSYISKGIPVGVVAVHPIGPDDDEKHMVTIIGYDQDFYYTAAGNKNGKATVYPKGDFYKHGTSYKIIKINIYK